MTDEGGGFMGVGVDRENVGCTVHMKQIMRDPTNAVVVAVDNNKLGICCLEPSRAPLRLQNSHLIDSLR